MLTTDFRDKTIELLNNRPVWLTIKIISEETTIPEGWLKMFSQLKISDPGVNRVETLNKYLIKKVS